ncbi:MAG: hypothetical protein MI743_11670, partial [Sneathiellales bacterium]|nr:hypothetical protein [Sneathiellales bacterium]
SNSDVLKFKLRKLSGLFSHWREYLALGTPSSLSYVGVSAISGCIVYQLQVWNAGTYETSVASYGIVNRLFTFGYMPLLGLTLAQQAIVGNNFGARNWERVVGSLKITLGISFIYCLILQVIFILYAGPLSSIFVENDAIVAETIRILPPLAALYMVFGPLLMFPSFFQSIGDAKRAGLLGLSKIYVFSVPLILFLPLAIGEIGIWYASPLTEVLGLMMTGYVIWRSRLFSKKAGENFLPLPAEGKS